MTQSVLDHELLSQRYFFPRRKELENTFWVEHGDIRLSCYYHQPFPDAKTVIYFHGNGEIVEDYLELFVPVFEQLGFNLFLAEYRGYGMSTGEPGLAAMLEDVEHIIKAVGKPLDQLVLFGRSIGSLYAIHGASIFPEIPGLIIESGVAEILERVLLRAKPEELGVHMTELEKAVATDFNHQEKLGKYKGSTFVMHAEHDSMVSCMHGLKLHQWAPDPKAMKIFEKGDHNDIFYVNSEEYFTLIYQFISVLQ